MKNRFLGMKMGSWTQPDRPDLEEPGKRTENLAKPPELLSAMAGPIVNYNYSSDLS